MKHRFLLIGLFLLAAGCVATGPAISKCNQGNLYIEVKGTDNSPLDLATIYIDGHFIGNSDHNHPVLYLKKGPRQIRVTCPGYKTYEQTIVILGEPNRQVLNVILEP